MFILLNKKKNESLCLELLQFVLLILITPPPSSLLSLLSYTGTCKIITFKPWSYLRETGQNVPTFFQNTFFFTKTLPILFAKMACLIKKNSTQTMISCGMSCNSRFVQ